MSLLPRASQRIKIRVKTINTGSALPGGGNVVTRLDTLQDVTEGPSPQDGDTLVYNSLTDKYEVRPIELDGGTF
jgi:hypothetical protein